MPKAKKTKVKKETKALKKTKSTKEKIHPVKSPTSRGISPKAKLFNRVKKSQKKIKKGIKKKTEREEVAETKYYEAVGRRKRAVARIRIFTKGKRGFLINNKPLKAYFPTHEFQKTATASLEKMKCLDKFNISVVVRGGGLNAQSEAVRHGIARALMLFNPDFRKRLKKAGFLKRDSRMRERKKPGLKRARRAKQWKKR